MQLRYMVTNTGSVALAGVDIVTRLDGGDADAFTALINAELEKVGRGLSLEPGASVEIVVEVSAPAGYHVNEAIAAAPPVTATETVVSSIPGTTNATTTVPGSITTETTVVERTPNTPTNKAQSAPTSGASPCDCTVTRLTITPAPVTTTEAGKVTTVTPDPVTSEVTVTETAEPIVTTVVKTHEPITVTRTTPVTTVNTVTPEPQTLITTVAGPTVTETLEPPARVVVIVDDEGNSLTTVMPTPQEGGLPRETVTYTVPAITVTDVPTLITTTQQQPKDSVLGRCVANAVRSPILDMVPLLLAGHVLGDLAAPYVAQINEQFDRMSAEIQEQFRRNSPDFGQGRCGSDNEQAAEIRARVDAANRMLHELANRPEVRQYGEWAAIALGVIVAGSVLYDWCTNEAGEAFTAIGPKQADEGGSSFRGGRSVNTVVAPVTSTGGSTEGSSQ